MKIFDNKFIKWRRKTPTFRNGDISRQQLRRSTIFMSQRLESPGFRHGEYVKGFLPFRSQEATNRDLKAPATAGAFCLESSWCSPKNTYNQTYQLSWGGQHWNPINYIWDCSSFVRCLLLLCRQRYVFG